MQLFCFPYAGGNSDFYKCFDGKLDKKVIVTPIEYAGHGYRNREPLYKDLNEWTSDLVAQMKEKYIQGEDIALFGYSMGTISIMLVFSNRVAFDKNIRHVFLAAHDPYVKSKLNDIIISGDDKLFRDYIVRFGGIPDKLQENDIFWRTYLNIYKNDFKLISSYDFEKYSPRINIPATVLFSNEDTARKNMKGWHKYLVSDVEFKEFTGNHFFINDHCNEIASIIMDKVS